MGQKLQDVLSGSLPNGGSYQTPMSEYTQCQQVAQAKAILVAVKADAAFNSLTTANKNAVNAILAGLLK